MEKFISVAVGIVVLIFERIKLPSRVCKRKVEDVRALSNQIEQQLLRVTEIWNQAQLAEVK